MRVGDTQTDTLHVGDGDFKQVAQMISEDGRIEAKKLIVDTEDGQLTIHSKHGYEKVVIEQ